MGKIIESLNSISDSFVEIYNSLQEEFGKRGVSFLARDILEYDYESVPRKAKFTIKIVSADGVSLKFIFNFFDKEKKIKNEVLIIDESKQKKTKSINPVFLEREDVLFCLSSFLKKQINSEELFIFLNLF